MIDKSILRMKTVTYEAPRMFDTRDVIAEAIAISLREQIAVNVLHNKSLYEVDAPGFITKVIGRAVDAEMHPRHTETLERQHKETEKRRLLELERDEMFLARIKSEMGEEMEKDREDLELPPEQFNEEELQAKYHEDVKELKLAG